MNFFTGSGVVVGPNHLLAVRPDMYNSALWRMNYNSFDSEALDMPDGFDASATHDVRPHPFMPLVSLVRFELPEFGEEQGQTPGILPIADLAMLENGTECTAVGWNVLEGELPGMKHLLEFVHGMIAGRPPMMEGDGGMMSMMQNRRRRSAEEEDKEEGSKEPRALEDDKDLMIVHLGDMLVGKLKKNFRKMASNIHDKLMPKSTASKVQQVTQQMNFLDKESCHMKLAAYGICPSMLERFVCATPTTASENGQCGLPEGTALVCNGKLRGITMGMMDMNQCKYNWPQLFFDVTQIKDWVQQECDNCMLDETE